VSSVAVNLQTQVRGRNRGSNPAMRRIRRILGLLLIASAALAVSLFAASLARTQVVAVILAGALLGALFLIYFVSILTDPPFNTFLSALSIFHVRQRSFMTGVLKLENVVYNLAVAFLFLFATTKTLEARRWR